MRTKKQNSQQVNEWIAGIVRDWAFDLPPRADAQVGRPSSVVVTEEMNRGQGRGCVAEEEENANYKLWAAFLWLLWLSWWIACLFTSRLLSANALFFPLDSWIGGGGGWQFVIVPSVRRLHCHGHYGQLRPHVVLLRSLGYFCQVSLLFSVNWGNGSKLQKIRDPRMKVISKDPSGNWLTKLHNLITVGVSNSR